MDHCCPPACHERSFFRVRRPPSSSPSARGEVSLGGGGFLGLPLAVLLNAEGLLRAMMAWGWILVPLGRYDLSQESSIVTGSKVPSRKKVPNLLLPLRRGAKREGAKGVALVWGERSESQERCICVHILLIISCPQLNQFCVYSLFYPYLPSTLICLPPSPTLLFALM